MRLHRATILALLSLGALGGCGADRSAPPCGGAPCPTTTAPPDAGPPPPPSCRGTPIPPGEVPVEADGRTVVVKAGDTALRVTVLDDGILRLRYVAPTAEPPARPSYALADTPWPPSTALVGSTADAVLICTDQLLVEVSRATLRVRATQSDGTVILEDGEGDGFIDALDAHDAHERRVTHRAAAGERFYGLGEKTGPLDKRGRSLTFWNTDAYQSAFGGYPPDADPLYTSIPFFIGLRGGAAYGFFLDDPHRMTVDLAAADPSTYTFTTKGGAIDQYLIAGPGIPAVIERYTRLTGRMPLPPRWALGYHQSRWGYSPAAKVVEIAQGLRDRDLPADALWLDIQHLDGFRSFTWDPQTFPDPEGLTQTLRSMGFSVVSIVDPGIKVDPAWDVYSTCQAKGYFLPLGGAPYVGKVWPGDASFPDFTSPDVRAFWASLVPRTVGKGVSGLWIDMNEPSNFTGMAGGTVPDELLAAGDGVPGTMAELHNVYALEEARATREGMLAATPDRRPFLLTRAGYAGIQRYAATWTGDAPSTWETLRGSLPMMLGMGLSGLPFVGSDVGGYSGGPSPELFARWMQVGSLSPFFRDHVAEGTPDQEPWHFGTEVLDLSREAIRRRYELVPYLYSLFHEASATGAPILRPLVYAFQADPPSQTIADEVLVGDSLLFAPVIEEGATARSVYLPPGRWFERSSGAAFDGGQTIQTDVPLGALPSYVRGGAILPHVDHAPTLGAPSKGPLYLDLYPADHPTSFTLYEDDGQSLAFAQGAFSRVACTLTGLSTGARLDVGARSGSFSPPSRPLILRVRRVDHGPTAVRLDGKDLPVFPTYEALLAAGEGRWYDERDLSLVVVVPDHAGFTLEMDYDPTLIALAPPVLMPVVVTVPAGTPQGTPIHIATSASGWTHQPLAWGPAPGTASGLVPVPRGQWVHYKYTRGDWSTVEKYPGCVEAKNRYELGKANPPKLDTVYQWADQCP